MITEMWTGKISKMKPQINSDPKRFNPLLNPKGDGMIESVWVHGVWKELPNNDHLQKSLLDFGSNYNQVINQSGQDLWYSMHVAEALHV